MADNTKNCPFSATAGTTDYAMTCDEVRAANTNAGCPFFDSSDNTCSIANVIRRMQRVHGKEA